MLLLIPALAWILCFFGWDSLHLPVEFQRLMEITIIFSAIACAYPLRKIFQRANPLGLGGKLFVFVIVVAIWFSAFTPLAMIFNVKFDSSPAERLERKILETRSDQGPNVCVVKVQEWKPGAGESWLWLDCKDQKKIGESISYELRKGALGFAWISSNNSGM